jgi:hypothetical protein
VTTITTVGYGDISAYNMIERIICVLLMITGVIAFSFSTGSLSSILSNYDQSQAILKEKISTLNEINNKHKLSQELYDEIMKIVKYDNSKIVDDYQHFSKELPQYLQTKLAMEIHKHIYTEIHFFKGKSEDFISWVIPMLKKMMYQKDQYIYSEGELNDYVYFIDKGKAGFVLPRYQNTIYIIIEQGDYFGVIDMVPLRENKQNKFQHVTAGDLRRVFTV